VAKANLCSQDTAEVRKKALARTRVAMSVLVLTPFRVVVFCLLHKFEEVSYNRCDISFSRNGNYTKHELVSNCT